MKTLLVLLDDDGFSLTNFYNYSDCELNISINENSNLKELLNQKEQILSSILKQNRVLPDKYILNLLKSINYDIDKIIDNIGYVIFNFDLEFIKKYIDNSPLFNNYKILINNDIEYSVQYINRIESIFQDRVNLLYFKLEDNEEIVSFKDFKDTILIISNIVDEVKRYNLSPFEQVMYVYDYVRKKEYSKEEQTDSYNESRDLTKVLLGDKIVCVGYSNIFNRILSLLDMKCMPYFLKKNEKKGHQRSVVYINDPKYGIDGVYYFDPTWNSKNKNNNYLLSYKFFARTKEEIDKYKNFEDITFGKFDKAFVEYICNKILTEDLESLTAVESMYLNNAAKFIDNKSLIPKKQLLAHAYYLTSLGINTDKDYLVSKIKYYYELLNRKIIAEKYLECLINVRKIEHYNNPTYYRFSINEVYYILINSKWEFEITQFERLYNLIYGNNANNYKKMMLLEFLSNNDFGKNIEMVGLTRI